MRKFLYLILFVMTLCVFCCSCSQKTNDVKKTSSQHEKKLKSVPNNNTKEDVISEEDLEKDMTCRYPLKRMKRLQEILCR